MEKVTVIGGGSWATAIVKILSNNVDNINWWVPSAETAELMRKYKHNPNYLSDVEINLFKVHVTNHLNAALADSEIIILAVPSAFLKPALEKIKPSDFKNKSI